MTIYSRTLRGRRTRGDVGGGGNSTQDTTRIASRRDREGPCLMSTETVYSCVCSYGREARTLAVSRPEAPARRSP